MQQQSLNQRTLTSRRGSERRTEAVGSRGPPTKRMKTETNMKADPDEKKPAVANISATVFEERVYKLVRFSNTSGNHECLLCFRQYSYRRSAVDPVKTRHLDRADHHCKYCPAVFKTGIILPIMCIRNTEKSTNWLKFSVPTQIKLCCPR